MGWCHSCSRQETPVGRWYSICGECGHVYRSRRELRREYRRGLFECLVQEWRDIRRSGVADELFFDITDSRVRARRRDLVREWCGAWTVHADKIQFCPLCMHDFLPISRWHYPDHDRS